jgi:hypothetical protein
MVTTVHDEPRRASRHLSTWLQAIGFVYTAPISISPRTSGEYA